MNIHTKGWTNIYVKRNIVKSNIYLCSKGLINRMYIYGYVSIEYNKENDKSWILIKVNIYIYIPNE